MAGVACDNTARGVKQDTAEATEAARKADAAKAEAKEEAAEATAEGREAAADAKRTAGEAGAAIDAAKETIDVKTALMADDVGRRQRHQRRHVPRDEDRRPEGLGADRGAEDRGRHVSPRAKPKATGSTTS